MTRTYRALLFDLFGTIVHFRPPPTGATPAFEWLRAELVRTCPDVPFDAFAAAVMAASREIAAGRAPEYREVPSRERFRRALNRLRPGGDHGAAADALSLAHMAEIAARTELPASHGPLLHELGRRYRLGIVSNFDHAPTAHAILARHGVTDCFASVVISEAHGRRKPHPDIFHAALAQLATAPADALYIGDSHDADVVGALAAGLDVAWIDRHAEAPLDPRPTYVLAALTDLPAIL